MNNSALPPKRSRSRRFAVLIQPGKFARLWECLRRSDVLLRLALCFASAVLLWVITGGWEPPFPFRTGQVPTRDVVSRIEFKVRDDEATRALKRQKRTETPCVYKLDPKRLPEFCQGLKDKLFRIIREDAFDKLANDVRQEFFPAVETTQAGDLDQAFLNLKETFADDMDLSRFELALGKTFADFERDGLLAELEHKPENGSATTILVHPAENENTKHLVSVNAVRIPQALAKIEKRLPDEMRDAKFPEQQLVNTSNLLVQWMKPRLPKTLSFNEAASEAEWREVEKKIDESPEYKIYPPGTPIALSN